MLHYLDKVLDNEIQSGPAKPTDIVFENVSRSGVLQGITAGFALAAFSGEAAAFARYHVGGTDMPNGLRYDPLLFVSMDFDGIITIVAHRAEMGTGSRTSLPMPLRRPPRAPAAV